MGLFKKQKLDNVELAYQLFNTLGVGGTPDEEYKSAIDNIYSECTDEQKGYAPQKALLLKVIELAGKPDTPKQRYLLGEAYAWLGAKYRQQAIEYIELYLKGPLWEECYTKGRTVLSSNAATDSEAFEINRLSHLAEMYDYLGAAYEGEYEFQKALEAYSNSLKCLDKFPAPYLKMIDVLRKMNRLDLALDVIEIAKDNKMYHANGKVVAPEYDFDNMSSEEISIIQELQWDAQWSNDFTNVINSKEQEIKDKIARGYVYKPRRRKTD